MIVDVLSLSLCVNTNAGVCTTQSNCYICDYNPGDLVYFYTGFYNNADIPCCRTNTAESNAACCCYELGWMAFPPPFPAFLSLSLTYPYMHMHTHTHARQLGSTDSTRYLSPLSCYHVITLSRLYFGWRHHRCMRGAAGLPTRLPRV